MNVHVMKFGGSSFRSARDYLTVAAYARERSSAGDKVVLVVSAMSGTTGRLLALGEQLNDPMDAELQDGLLTTGETVSAVLAVQAARAVGLRATGLPASENGIRTDSNFGRAHVLKTDPVPLRRALDRHDVVVVGGGQASDAHGRITMMGRNSSDLTAVLLAAALGREQCEIYSDVPGVYSFDPHREPAARLLEEVPYASAIALSWSGAKVLHHDAVRVAERANVRIECRGTAAMQEIGTVIGKGTAPKALAVMETPVVWPVPSGKSDVGTMLATRGILSACVHDEDDTFLVLSPADAVPAAQLLACWGFRTGHNAIEESNAHARSLVTVLQAEAGVRCGLVPSRDVATVVRRWHWCLYPDVAPERGHTPPLAAKTKSADSGVLVGHT